MISLYECRRIPGDLRLIDGQILDPLSFTLAYRKNRRRLALPAERRTF